MLRTRATTTTTIWVLLGIIVALEATPDYTGLTGPYCETRYRQMRCCEGRKDDCSVPIMGTLCYCDEFCNARNRSRSEDCCPDYLPHCHGEAPTAINTQLCNHKGRSYYPGNKFKENCNICECTSLEGNSEIMCEDNRCLMDQDLIDRINYVETAGWMARNYSEFYGHTLKEGLQKRLGTENPTYSVMRMNAVRRVYNPDDLPQEFDSRQRWPRHIRPVHDQGWCGASWAISTVDVASDRFAIMSKGTENPQLSAQHLISCNNRGQLACNGGYLDRAWLFMRKFGLTDEECYPWIGHGEKCRVQRRGKLSDANCKRRHSYALRNELYKVGPAYRLGNETDIMHEILTSGPVQATMMVYQDFFHYESGIYRHSRLSEMYPTGYHSVRIIGWGEEPSSFTGTLIKFWRVANSWGREWGEDGYFRIVRGTNECEIEQFVLGVWAKTV
ncbi:tubulointerstitial nephritis antigen-like [Phymastichus coffea]|uniref:tubulointerstitial nephritis antigen-like n=1 Tax=Phymastichus coffea TaxID=108790 RepID=UPI00273C34D8|nr:tubulointerstitial nephritis antigen-like [Phymastichus coffea]